MMDISIHAPAKGATVISVLFSLGIRISIHAPAKGATGWQFDFLHCRESFQSTLPRRERLNLIVYSDALDAISIHAPAKGATLLPCGVSLSRYRFQSTLPRRERQLLRRQVFHPSFYFNPRSREGSDSDKCLFCRLGGISIHAPVKGATHPPRAGRYNPAISIHAPVKGATVY